MSSKEIKSTPMSLHRPLNIDDKDLEKDILKPYTHISSSVSKNIRRSLITLLSNGLSIPEEMLKLIHHSVDLLHTSSLLLDDIQDSSLLRRSAPAAHTLYGIPRTLIAIDWIAALSFESISKFNNIELSKYSMKKLCDSVILIGQGLELYWRDNHICPTEEEWFRMAYIKTASYFLLILKCINAFSKDNPIDGERLLTALGIQFQMKDDYKNLQDQEYFEVKGFCEDITEGKFSFPIVHAVNNFPKEGQEIIEILKICTFDVDIKKHCLGILEKCGSLEYTRKKIQEFEAIIKEELTKIDNPPFATFVNTFLMLIIVKTNQ